MKAILIGGFAVLASDSVIDRLYEEFGGIYSRETIAEYHARSSAELRAARVQAFVPLLGERFTKERLRALAQAEGLAPKDVPEVLFVCVQNAGRSQMAAGLLDHHAQGRVHVRSAGSAPAGEIHDGVRRAMEEVGVDLSKEFPKPLTDDVVRAADVVITMGCGDACPVYPGKRYLNWELPDPSGKSIERVRAIREDIEGRVLSLLDELASKDSRHI